MLTLVLLCANTATIAENYDPNAICFMANFVMQKKSDVENNKKWMAKAEPFMNLFLKQGETREDFYQNERKTPPFREGMDSSGGDSRPALKVVNEEFAAAQYIYE